MNYIFFEQNRNKDVIILIPQWNWLLSSDQVIYEPSFTDGDYNTLQSGKKQQAIAKQCTPAPGQNIAPQPPARTVHPSAPG